MLTSSTTPEGGHRSATGETEAQPNWSAIWALTLCVFGLVTAEFLPASLLTLIARDLGVTAGTAGQTVTATALIAAIAGPIVVVTAGRVNRRIVVNSLSLLFIFSCLLASFATNIWMLLFARVVLGFSLGGIWSLAAALALRLVPVHLMPRAMMIIFTGVSAATVCAPALGAFLGDLWGWRATFMVSALIGAAAILVQFLTLPSMPATTSSGLGTFFVLLKRPQIRVGLVTIILAISGHFSGFTYVRPFLEQISKLDVNMIALVLFAYGICGFLGNLAGGFIAERSARIAVSLATLLMSAMAFLLLAYGASLEIAFVAVSAWGFAFGAIPVGTQTWTTQAATDHAESAGAIGVTTFQIAIALGAIAGGVLVDGFGAEGAIAYSAFAVLAGSLVMLVFGREGKPGDIHHMKQTSGVQHG